jgi:hypothetical protein
MSACLSQCHTGHSCILYLQPGVKSDLPPCRIVKELEIKEHALALLAERVGHSQASQVRGVADTAQGVVGSARSGCRRRPGPPDGPAAHRRGAPQTLYAC